MVATEIGQKRAYGKPQSGSWWIVGNSELTITSTSERPAIRSQSTARTEGDVRLI